MTYKNYTQLKSTEESVSAFSNMSMPTLFELVVKLGTSLAGKGVERPSDKQRIWIKEALADAQNVIRARLNRLYLNCAPRNESDRLAAFIRLPHAERDKFREDWIACDGLECFVPNGYNPVGTLAGAYFPDRDRMAVWNGNVAPVPIPYKIEEIRIVVPDEATRIYV
jgi:hypothetical protein